MQSEINFAISSYLSIITIIIISLLIKKYNVKKRIWTRKWIELRPTNGAYNQLLRELDQEDPQCLRNFLRMDRIAFNEIAALIRPIIQKQTTRFRSPISVE